MLPATRWPVMAIWLDLSLFFQFINANNLINRQNIDNNLVNLSGNQEDYGSLFNKDNLMKDNLDDRPNYQIDGQLNFGNNKPKRTFIDIPDDEFNSKIANFNSTNNETNDYRNFVDINSSFSYYGYFLHKFRINFILLHGYISEFVCFFGIIANILNIIVLTR